MRAARTWVFGGALLWLATLAAPANVAAPCQVHVILFVPADVRPPTGYQQRADQIVGYAESFFRRELGRWGYERVVMPFRRTPDGHVEVEVMRGKEPAAHYKPVPLRAEVMDTLRRQNRIDDGRQIWWILVYAGDPPARFDGFLGGYHPPIGGWSVANFDTTPGRIDPAAPMGSDFPVKLMLKGMLHELGHGFDLPHMGPLDRDNAGNTLMGPTHRHFQYVRRHHEPRVYLSRAEAAILSVHPAFRGVRDQRTQVSTVEVQGMQYAADLRSRALLVSGRVQAPKRAVYALVADEAAGRPGEYWTKTYVARVGPDGTFHVAVTEPWESSGTLRTGFVFEDGSQTVHPRGTGRSGGILRTYAYSRQGWTFE